MILLRLTWKSLWNRRISLLLSVLSIAISISLLLGIEYLQKEAKASFMNTISGTDLVVGGRTGPVQLLLYSVFRIGNATNNIGWDSYQKIANNKLVKWTIPISLGDSHKGYRVLGTNQDYFKYYRYGNKQNLGFSTGKPFDGVYDAVLGSEVAAKLGYQLNDKIVIAHGGGVTSFTLHDDKPFTVVGILKSTGTPIDRTVHVSLRGIEAIHVDWRAGTHIPGYTVDAEKAASMKLQPKVITAFLVGLKTRVAVFKLQREINEYRHEALLAIVPGIALSELWQTIGQFETVLRIITIFVVITGLLGMLTTLLSTLNERRREMAILRAVGAHPSQILKLFVLESFIIASLASLISLAFVFSAVLFARSWILAEYGMYLHTWLPSMEDFVMIGVIVMLAVVFSLIPGGIAYRRSLQDGLTVKI